MDRSPIDASVLFPQGLCQRDEEDGEQRVVGGGGEKEREKIGSLHPVNVRLRLFPDFPLSLLEIDKRKETRWLSFPSPSTASTKCHQVHWERPLLLPLCTTNVATALVLCSTGQSATSSPLQPWITAVSSHPGCQL